MDANHILNLAMTAGVLALIACPVLAIILAGLVPWGRGLADRNAAQAVTISGLERRLADAERLNASPATGPGAEEMAERAKDREAKAERNRAMAERLEVILSAGDYPATGGPVRRPAPGVYAEDQGGR